MQQRPASLHRQIHPQAPPRLPPRDAEIVVPPSLDRESAEHHVAVRLAPMPSVLADDEGHPHLARQALRLVPHSLLPPHHLRPQVPPPLPHSPRSPPAVPPPALMDVVRRPPQPPSLPPSF